MELGVADDIAKIESENKIYIILASSIGARQLINNTHIINMSVIIVINWLNVL